MKSKIKIGAFIIVSGLLVLVVSLFIQALFAKPTASQTYANAVTSVQSSYEEFKSKNHAIKKPIPASKLLDPILERGDIDWVCTTGSTNIETDGNACDSRHPVCKAPNTKCIFLLDHGILAYSTKQLFDPSSKDNYVNITVIPYGLETTPASILLFSDGRVLSGENYKIGKQAKDGLEIIKTDPSYVRE